MVAVAWGKLLILLAWAVRCQDFGCAICDGAAVGAGSCMADSLSSDESYVVAVISSSMPPLLLMQTVSLSAISPASTATLGFRLGSDLG